MDLASHFHRVIKCINWASSVVFISLTMLRAIYTWSLQSIVCDVVTKDVMSMLSSYTLVNLWSLQRSEVFVLATRACHHAWRAPQYWVIIDPHLSTNAICLSPKLFSVLVLITFGVDIERLLQALVGLVMIWQNVLEFFLLHLLLMMRDWLQHPNCLILGGS